VYDTSVDQLSVLLAICIVVLSCNRCVCCCRHCSCSPIEMHPSQARGVVLQLYIACFLCAFPTDKLDSFTTTMSPLNFPLLFCNLVPTH
jgi:hypothetical protein